MYYNIHGAQHGWMQCLARSVAAPPKQDNGQLSAHPIREYNRTFVVDGNQTLEADCLLETDRRLTIFVKFNDKPNQEELTQFDLANLTVTN